jgi:hypothetical protein
MATFMTAIYVTVIVGLLVGGLVDAIIHGWGFSLILKKQKPKFSSRFALHIVSLVAVTLVMWLLKLIFSPPLSISSVILQMIVYVAALSLIYVVLTTKITQAWFSLSWDEALKSLRILHILYVIILAGMLAMILYGSAKMM